MAPLPPARWRLTREGRYWLPAALLLTLTGWVKGINLILLLGYLLLGMLALNAWIPRRSWLGARFRRRLEDRIVAGQSASWIVELQAPASQAAFGWHLCDGGPQALFKAPLPLERYRSQWTPLSRGRIEIPPAELRTSFPFGLVERVQPLCPPESVVVLPRMGALRLEVLRHSLRSMQRIDSAHRLLRRATIQAEEFQGLRGFRAGDSPRWIHWRTSARQGELMVREFDFAGQAEQLVLLDLGEGPNSEAAISLAATLVDAWAGQEHGRLVVAWWAAEPKLDRLAGDRAGALRCLRELAAWQPTGEADPERFLATWVACRLPAGSAALITSRADAAARATEFEALLRRAVVPLAAEPSAWYDPPVARGQ